MIDWLKQLKKYKKLTIRYLIIYKLIFSLLAERILLLKGNKRYLYYIGKINLGKD
jgi:hypothetical protein